MKLLFLGTGTGISSDLNNFQSNMILITDTGKKLLIDCGTDIRFSLANANCQVKDIDAVYISHSHADHSGGLEWLAFQRKFVLPDTEPELLIHNKLAPLLWEHTLSGGMKTLCDRNAQLEDFFKVKYLKDDQSLVWEQIEIETIKTVHMHSNHQVIPSYGISLKYKGKYFFISTDTQFMPQCFSECYLRSELIFHDCETLKIPSSVHSHFDELCTLDETIKSKIWLYHYNDGDLPDATAHGFKGFVKLGQIIELVA